MNHLKGFFALLACAIIFASFSVFVRLLSVDFTPYQQIGFRNVIAFVVGLIAVMFSRQSFASLTKVPSKYILAYTLTFPVAVIFYTLSVLEIKIITTIFGLYLGALITSLVVGTLFFKEKITTLKLVFPAALPRGTLKEGAETLGFCNN
jgi:drug/metabolite transporter (DMT)-like permease